MNLIALPPLPPSLALLPGAWFADLPTLVLLVIAAIALAVVIKGADWLVEGMARLAYRFGIPKIVVGATIVSLGTTSPECAVSVLAAFQGNAGLALGNGVGSIIADTALIFGVGCLMISLPADRYILVRQGWWQFGSAALLAAVCYALFFLQGSEQAAVPRVFGVVLVVLLGVYLWMSIKWAKSHPGVVHTDAHHVSTEPGHADPDEDNDAESKAAWLLVGMALIGIVCVVFAGDAAVRSVTVLAERWGVPNVVIAATLVAFGTSLPELMVAITSIRKGHPELLIGNVIGADILNVLFVIGFAAIAKDLPIAEGGNTIFLWLHLPTMLIALVLFRIYIMRANRVGHFSRWMGVPMVALYLAYVAAQWLLSAPGKGAH